MKKFRTNSLGHLRKMGLIEYVSSKELKATKELFPDF